MVQVGSGKLQAVPGEPLKFEWAELGRGDAVSGASGFFNGLLALRERLSPAPGRDTFWPEHR